MLKILKRLTVKEVTMLIFAVLFVCLNVYLELKIPDYMSDITTLLSTEGTKVKDIFAWNFDAPGMRMVWEALRHPSLSVSWLLVLRQVLVHVYVMTFSIVS